MLVSNVDGEMAAASMVRDSKFYIDLAKFVQAYAMIVQNPNDFLREVGEAEINQKSDFLTWAQFLKIMQTCDFGFETKPTEMELVVFYNYALEMGSLKDGGKKVASVKDIVNAQKHYYNFVDESTDKAQTEFLKQKQISDSRDREARNVDAKLVHIKIKNIIIMMFMTLGVLLFTFGLASCFIDNRLASTVGKIIPGSRTNIVGGVIFMVVGIVLFAILNGFYIKSKYAYLKLRDASQTIFDRSDSAFHDTLVLKGKLNSLKEDLKVVKSELADKNKTFDVATNIEKLAATNKYYKQFAGEEISFAAEEHKILGGDTIAPVKLTKEQYENVRSVGKEAIVLSNELDEETYVAQQVGSASQEKGNESEKESEEVYSEFSGTLETDKELNKDETENLKEIEKEQLENQNKKQDEKEIDELKDLLGLGD